MPETKSNQAVNGRTPASAAGVARAALLNALGTLSSRILGLVRDQLMFALFSRTVTDAFSVAFKLPNMFRRLLGEGSLSVAFIPVYVEALGAENDAKARDLAAAVFTLMLSLSALLSAAGIVFMEPLLDWLVSGDGFRAVEGKFELTLHLARIMFAYLFLVTMYAYFSAILQAHKKFFIAALAPALFNVFFVASTLIPEGWGRIPGEYLAWGVIAGGVAQAALVLGLLVRMGRMPGLSFRWRQPQFAKVLRNMLPGILGLGVLQIMSVVNVKFASRLPEGAQSYIYLGDRLLELPQALIAISLGTAMLPNLSELWARGLKHEMIAAAHRHTRLLLFLSLPSAVGLFALARPIVEILFGRGTFGAADVAGTTLVVQIYSVLLVTSGLARVTVPSFYAIHNTWVPAVSSALCLIVHVFLARFMVDAYGLGGLVGATTVTGTLNYLTLLVFYRRLIGPTGLGALAASGLRLVPSLIVLYGAAFGGFYVVEQGLRYGTPAIVAKTAALALAIGLGGAVYFAVNHALKIQESREMLSAIARRLRRR